MPTKNSGLTQNNFDSLLEWLDSNRAKAGEKYENIRNGLIQVFNYKGCVSSEELADETIDRVARKANELRLSYVGNPARYFYGVGKKVYLEYAKKKPTLELPTVLRADDQWENVEREYDCLDRCLQKLNDRNRVLLLRYYAESKQAKIDSRRALLQAFNLKPSALRVRVFRLKATLERCVRKCLETDNNSVTE